MVKQLDPDAVDAEFARLRSRIESAEKFNQINLTNNAVLAAALFQMRDGATIDFEKVAAVADIYFEGPNAAQKRIISGAIENLKELMAI